MSNKSSIYGKWYKKGDDKVARYDEMILSKQRKAHNRKRKQERQNKRKGRK